jgi:hypothetical protein
MAAVEAGCSKGAVGRLARFWPASDGSGHNRIEAEEETPTNCIGGTTEEGIYIGGAVKGRGSRRLRRIVHEKRRKRV